MAKFDRDAFKASKTESLKKQQEETEKKNSTGRSNSGDKNYLSLEVGSNTIRILPAHPGSESFTEPKAVHFLDTKISYEKKDGERVEEIKRMPHLSSKVHGGTEKCIIDEYISAAFRIAYRDYPDDDKARVKFMTPILDWKTGLKGSTRWIVYAKKDGKLGLLDLPTSVKDKLNELATQQDQSNDVIATDPYTDPDTGRSVFITKADPKDKVKPADYYKVSVDFNGPTPLEDEDLEWLGEQKSLKDMYTNIYKQKDFYRALDSLKMFDEKHNKGIFADDEFLDVCEKIASYYPDEEDEEKKEMESRDLLSEKQAPKKESKKDTDLPFDLELDEMNMNQLKGYIRRKNLDVKVLPDDTEDDVIYAIKRLEKIARSTKQEDPVSTQQEDSDKKSSRLNELADGLDV